MRRSARQKLDGWGWDWTSLKSRRITRWGSGVGKYIKTRLSRQRRKAGKKESWNDARS